MVVPVGLQMEASDNNDHQGLFPESSLLQVLHEEQNRPAKLSVENMESSKEVDPAGFVQQRPLQFKSWSLGSSSQGGTDWPPTTPRSSFLQLLSLPPPSTTLGFLSNPSHPFTTLELLKPRDHKGGAALAHSSPGGSGGKMRGSSRLNRRDDAAAAQRVGKMTSLGASPKCNVCSHKPNEARVVTFCGHLFCWPCLCCWLHNKSPDKECPVCNRPLTKNHITPLHGRQNNLTVARLQGMLRPDSKGSTRSSSASRGEAGSSSGGKRHTKAVGAVVTVTAPSMIQEGFPKDDTVTSPQQRHDGCSLPPPPPPKLADDTITRILSKRTAVPMEEPCGDAEYEAPAAAPASSRIVPQQQQHQYVQHHVHHPVNAISTPSTVVSTGIPVSESKAAAADHHHHHHPEEGSPEEMGELGVLLSLEWEGAMSAIENAWWNAVSDVLNKNSIVDETPRVMTAVERLSREKEKIIHELASEPLEGSQWLPARLDSFRTVKEELDSSISLTSGARGSPGQEFSVEIDDWFVDFPDEGEPPQCLFPDMQSSSQDEDTSDATDLVQGNVTSQWIKQPPDLIKPCRLQKKRKMDDETVKNYFQL